MSDNILTEIGNQLAQMLSDLVDYVPNILFAVLLVILGFVIGDLLGRAVSHLLHILKIDRALDQAGMDNVSKRLGFGVSISRFVGQVVKWAIVVSFTLQASDSMGLRAFSVYLSKVLNYLPNVLVAGLILVATNAIGEFVRRLVDGSARAAGLHVRMAGNICKYTIIVFGVLSALSELNIAAQFMETLFTGIVAAASIALGLSFGLGGKEAAARFIDKVAE